MKKNKTKRLPWSIAIIAGGKSTRFGSAKIDAPYRGTSLIENAVDIALRISDDFYIILNQKKHNFPKSWQVYSDVIPDCGPIGGLYTALNFSPSAWVGVMPVDMPFLRPAVYTLLNENRYGERPVVACSSAGLEPLISLWPKSFAPVVKKAIDDCHFKIQKILRESEAIEVDLNKYFPSRGDQILFNINYPEDLHKIWDKP